MNLVFECFHKLLASSITYLGNKMTQVSVNTHDPKLLKQSQCIFLTPNLYLHKIDFLKIFLLLLKLPILK